MTLSASFMAYRQKKVISLRIMRSSLGWQTMNNDPIEKIAIVEAEV
jgi:hypothetical protein